jgi:hypothetical protein
MIDQTCCPISSTLRGRQPGNRLSKSPRTMYPSAARPPHEPRGKCGPASTRWVGARVGGMVSRGEPLQASSRMNRPTVLTGLTAAGRGGSTLPRHGHPTLPAQKREPNPPSSQLRNTVSPYGPLRGRRTARTDDSRAGRGWGSKRMPGCNGRDTGCDITRRESGPTSPWSFFTRAHD